MTFRRILRLMSAHAPGLFTAAMLRDDEPDVRAHVGMFHPFG